MRERKQQKMLSPPAFSQLPRDIACKVFLIFVHLRFTKKPEMKAKPNRRDLNWRLSPWRVTHPCSLLDTASQWGGKLFKSAEIQSQTEFSFWLKSLKTFQKLLKHLRWKIFAATQMRFRPFPFPTPDESAFLLQKKRRESPEWPQFHFQHTWKKAQVSRTWERIISSAHLLRRGNNQESVLQPAEALRESQW